MSLPSERVADWDWKREAKRQIDPVLNGYPFPELASAPSSTNLKRGFTYFDVALLKVRTWDGAAWQNHF